MEKIMAGLILDLCPASEIRRYKNDVSLWLGASIELALYNLYLHHDGTYYPKQTLT